MKAQLFSETNSQCVPTTMQAVVRNSNGVALKTIPVPLLESDDDVLVRVHYAAVCRTDVYAALGRRSVAKEPIVLGHEFSGVVVAFGDGVQELEIGDKVAVMPSLECGKCRECMTQLESACQHRVMMGIDTDGAFTEYVKVNQRAVYPIGQDIGMLEASYAEPIAASLAVFNTSISSMDYCLVMGTGRIAELTRRILTLKGFMHINVGVPKDYQNQYDVVIDTSADEGSLEQVLKLVRPRGRVILKNRAPFYTPVQTRRIVEMELTLCGAHYGDFQEALSLLKQEKDLLEGLIGKVYQLESFAEVFEREMNNESKKQFFRLSDF